MRNILAKLHNKLGDFWFDSLMVFVACRAADVINLFVGLWLVPKYVAPAELGAVMPLSSFASFLVLPIAIFTTAFTKEVNTLATTRKYGEMKTLIRGVFIGSAVFLIFAIFVAKITLPLFLERIRITNGSLGIIIIAGAFIGAIAPIYTSTLQALKKFKEFTIVNALGAPIRFLAMLFAMPYRALSGYFVGQAAGPGFSIVASLFFLKKELSVKARPYWSPTTARRFARLLIGVAATTATSSFVSLIEQTIIRQRLPELDSAAYYMVSRFTEMANLVAVTFSLTLFPYTAEAAANGKSTMSLVLRAALITFAINIPIAAVFLIFGQPILNLLPHGSEYAAYYWAIPWIIVVTAISSLSSYHVSTEISAAKFGFLKWYAPFHVICCALLLIITGYGYFTDHLPNNLTQFLAEHNITSLKAMLCWLTIRMLLPVAFSVHDLVRQKP